MSGPALNNPASATPQWQAINPNGTVKAGQQATTTATVNLPSVNFTSPVYLKAPKGNAAAIEIGPVGETTSTGYVLDPGDAIILAVANLNQLYLVGANTTDKLSWIGQ